MKSWVLLPILLTCAIAGHADEVLTSHPAFYAHVASAERLRQAFDIRPQDAAPPDAKSINLLGLATGWGQAELRTGGIVIDGRYWPWPSAQQPFGRAATVRMDLDLARVYEGSAQSGRLQRICVQSPAGSSGSAARWQHVVVIERKARGAPPQMAAWFAPYASCEAVFAGPQDELIAGAYDMQFESEQFISLAIFGLHDLQAPERRMPRYVLRLRNPADAFQFTVIRLAPR